MLEVLAGAPLLTLFLVVAVGTLVGAIPLGPLRFGPAGALFVGLAVGAWDPRLGDGFGVVQQIGLALFVYTIGLASGAPFFRDLRRQWPLMVVTTGLLAVLAVVVGLAGPALGLSGELSAGLYSGVLTATPALAAASAITDGSAAPAVGYAIAYPVGVIVTVIAVTFVARHRLPGRRDPDPLGAEGLHAVTVAVEHPHRIADIPRIAEVPGRSGGDVRISYLLRDDVVRVADPWEDLRAGDCVVVVGTPDAVDDTSALLGHTVDGHLADDRRVVTHRHVLVSDPEVAGRTVTELRIPGQFGGLITRVRRGDDEFLAHAEMKLHLGDRVLVVAPRDRMQDVADFLGDSERHVTEVDFWSMGIGVALGVAVGLISVPLGGGSLALGSAAGPLVVGLILGWRGRTGPLLWTIPSSANLTIRQLGLVLFLASVGLASGQAFASEAFSRTGLMIVTLSAVSLTLMLALFWLLGRAVGLSTPRVAGAMAGFVGQPAILSHVSSLLPDGRTENGYSATFAIGLIVKIVLVQFIVGM